MHQMHLEPLNKFDASLGVHVPETEICSSYEVDFIYFIITWTFFSYTVPSGYTYMLGLPPLAPILIHKAYNVRDCFVFKKTSYCNLI